VRRNSGHADFGRVLAQHLPDDLLAQAFAGDGACATKNDTVGGSIRSKGKAERFLPTPKLMILCDVSTCRYIRR
jgi:hypothetical protein